MRTLSKIMMTTGSVAAGLVACIGVAQAQEQGRVISSQAVIQQVAVPRQVCSNQQVAVQGQKSGAGGMMGAIAGGAIGNNVGAGSGRGIATVIGVIGGAMLGERVEGAPPVQMQTVQNCSTQTFYENRTSGYNVVYEYNGKQYNVQMPNDPGQFVLLQVTPVGGTSQPVQSTSLGIPAPVIQPMVQQPVVQQQIIQPQVAQPVIQQVVATPQVIYAPPPVIYARPYYPVVYPSVSIGFGWRGGYGHRHWH